MIDYIRRLSLLLLIFIAGCGYGQFQTARTIPAGEVNFTVAQLYVGNENIEKREGVAMANFPQQVDMRIGLSDQLDLGVKFFFFFGLLADVKINFMPRDQDFALALHGGMGGAWVDPLLETSRPWVLHVPAGVIASYRFLNQLSPYLGLDYGFYWILGRKVYYHLDPGERFADRKGHGDGVMRFTLGLEWMLSDGFGLLVEYDVMVPVIDDPGDNFAFTTNHIVGIGIRF